MERPLMGDVAIVTGGGRGIGRGVARYLAESGCSVVIADVGGPLGGIESVDVGPAEKVAHEIRAAGGAAMAFATDVTDADGVRDLVDATVAEFGKVDILINNAGILRPSWSWETTAEDFAAVVKVHLFGQFNCMRAVLPIMLERGYGRIVNMTSRGSLGYPLQSAYGAAKAGILGLTYSVALEVAHMGVTVNAFGPVGPTRMGSSGASMTDEELDRAPINDAPFVAFLASRRAGYVNGQQFMSVPGVPGAFSLFHKPHPIAELRHPDPDGAWSLTELPEAFHEAFATSLVPVGALSHPDAADYARLTTSRFNLPNYWEPDA